MTIKKSYIFAVLCGIASTLNSPFIHGQSSQEKVLIRKGNENFEHGKYEDAEVDYRKALEINNSSYAGSYNLGSAFYRQEKFSDAGKEYQNIIEKAPDKISKSHAWHNLGNSQLKDGKFEESINSFKNALRLNPEDDDTRYNLAYAKMKLQQQQQQNQDNKSDQNNKDNKDQQNKDNKEDNKDKNEDSAENKNEQNKEKKNQEGKQEQPKISKEDAERILQALKNDEKELQQKMARKQGQKIVIDKNW